MARFNSALLLVLLALGHAADPDTANRTVIFSPQPALRTRAVQPQPVDNDPGVDFFKLVSKFLPVYPGVSEECRLDSLAVLQAVREMQPWALKSEYFFYYFESRFVFYKLLRKQLYPSGGEKSPVGRKFSKFNCSEKSENGDLDTVQFWQNCFADITF